MKVEFRFNSHNPRCILIPENSKDRQLLQLCFGEHDSLHVVPSSNPDVCIIESSDRPEKAEV